MCIRTDLVFCVVLEQKVILFLNIMSVSNTHTHTTHTHTHTHTTHTHTGSSVNITYVLNMYTYYQSNQICITAKLQHYKLLRDKQRQFYITVELIWYIRTVEPLYKDTSELRTPL